MYAWRSELLYSCTQKDLLFYSVMDSLCFSSLVVFSRSFSSLLLYTPSLTPQVVWKDKHPFSPVYCPLIPYINAVFLSELRSAQHFRLLSLNSRDTWKGAPLRRDIYQIFLSCFGISSLSAKQWGCWTPQLPVLCNRNKLNLIYTWMRHTREEEVSCIHYGHLTCLPPPFASEPCLSPTLIVFYLLPRSSLWLSFTIFFLSTNSFFTHLDVLAVSHGNCSVVLWVVDQAAFLLVCWPRACPMQNEITSACLQLRAVSEQSHTKT